jgi:hypothetical protein
MSKRPRKKAPLNFVLVSFYMIKTRFAMGLDHVRLEIEHMRLQVRRQRKDILRLQRAGIDATSAEALLARMLEKVDGLCGERDRLAGIERARLGRVAKGVPATRRA